MAQPGSPGWDFFVDGECVKTHKRVHPGERATDYGDYPAERAAYAMRDPEALIRTAKTRGEHLGRFAAQLLAGDFPWARLRQGQRLLRLAERYGAERVDAACRRALAFGMHNVKRVEAIVVDGLDRTATPSPAGEVVPLPARYLRPEAHFNHTPSPHPHPEENHGDPDIPQDDPQAPEALGHPRDPARRACRVSIFRESDTPLRCRGARRFAISWLQRAGYSIAS